MKTHGTDASALLRSALEKADRRERDAKLALIAATAIEAGLLGLALYLIDFEDRTHVLMLVLAVLVYATLALGMLAMAARASGANARVLHAIQMLDERLPS